MFTLGFMISELVRDTNAATVTITDEQNTCLPDDSEWPETMFEASSLLAPEQTRDAILVDLYRRTDFEYKHPRLPIGEMATRYARGTYPTLNQNGLELIIDPSIAKSNVDTATRDQDGIDLPNSLLTSIDYVAVTAQSYPPDVLSALNIQSIRVADIEADPTIGGQYFRPYKKKPGEIELEYNLPKTNATNPDNDQTLDKDDVQSYFAHEIGHALHNEYCNGGDYNDTDLTQSIDFIGTLDPGLSDDAVQRLYAAIPSEQLDYGPGRVFPNPYAATNAKEYFASVIAFTTEERGLIMRGDADYGSLLQEEQRLIVARVEQMFPGFTDFVVKRTAVLRSDASNEIYSKAPGLVTSITKLDRLVRSSGPDGLLLDGFVLVSQRDGRGSQIGLYPKIEVYKGRLQLTVFDRDPEYLGIELDPSQRNTEILFFPFNAKTKLLPIVDRQPTDITNLPARSGSWTGSPDVAAFLGSAKVKDITPLLLEFY